MNAEKNEQPRQRDKRRKNLNGVGSGEVVLGFEHRSAGESHGAERHGHKEPLRRADNAGRILMQPPRQREGGNSGGQYAHHHGHDKPARDQPVALGGAAAQVFAQVIDKRTGHAKRCCAGHEQRPQDHRGELAAPGRSERACGQNPRSRLQPENDDLASDRLNHSPESSARRRRSFGNHAHRFHLRRTHPALRRSSRYSRIEGDTRQRKSSNLSWNRCMS